MNITDAENKKIEVRESRNGKGVFTKMAFIKGEKILKIRGRLITCDIDDDLNEETRSNTYRYTKDLYMSPGQTVGNFLNHSCNPNIKVVKEKDTLYIVAIKNISKSREVCFDYSTITASDDVWTMQCNCGSAQCRKKISMFKKLPKEIQKKYISLEIVPQYILDIH